MKDVERARFGRPLLVWLLAAVAILALVGGLVVVAAMAAHPVSSENAHPSPTQYVYYFSGSCLIC